jgi:hypothetical protein
VLPPVVPAVRSTEVFSNETINEIDESQMETPIYFGNDERLRQNNLNNCYIVICYYYFVICNRKQNHLQNDSCFQFRFKIIIHFSLNKMMPASVPNYDRVLSLEDDFVTVKDSPFTEDGDDTRIPAVAVDWNGQQATFNVTLLSINNNSEERLWSDSFSISKIEKRHFELCLVYPELQSLLPKLPKDPQGRLVVQSGFLYTIFVPLAMA